MFASFNFFFLDVKLNKLNLAIEHNALIYEKLQIQSLQWKKKNVNKVRNELEEKLIEFCTTINKFQYFDFVDLKSQ